MNQKPHKCQTCKQDCDCNRNLIDCNNCAACVEQFFTHLDCHDHPCVDCYSRRLVSVMDDSVPPNAVICPLLVVD